MNCDSCKEARQGAEPVPYIVHEGTMARLERIVKRLWITVIILIVALIATNGAWIYYESLWEDVTITQENEAGYNSFIGNDGDIYYGETDY